MTPRIYRTSTGYDFIIDGCLYSYNGVLKKIGTVSDKYKSGILLKKVPDSLKGMFFNLVKK